MLDAKRNIIYVGKSKCLKKRVKSYFVNTPKWEKVKKLVSFIDDIEITVTDTHLEARLLECELIKAIQPVFNSQMKHDKGYVYVKINEYNPYHSLSVVHEREGISFGPFRSRYHLQEFIDTLKNIYPIVKTENRYEFEYHLFPVFMGRETFQENREILIELLSDANQIGIFIDELGQKMKEAASECKFETAAKYRDLSDGMNLLKNGINGYKNLVTKDILLTIPSSNAYKLLFISHGQVRLKQSYQALSDNMISHFIAAGKKQPLSDLSDMDEKSAIDFRDIIYSEIMSLPEEMVRMID
jgi:excinuclease ABC subunit C